jgi:hypothetical protein
MIFKALAAKTALQRRDGLLPAAERYRDILLVVLTLTTGALACRELSCASRPPRMIRLRWPRDGADLAAQCGHERVAGVHGWRADG